MTLASASSLDTLQQRLTESGLMSQVVDRHEAGAGLSIQLRVSAGGAK